MARRSVHYTDKARGTSSSYRWVILAGGILSQATVSAYFQGLSTVAPAVRRTYHLDLAQLGLLLGSASLGLVMTLVLWGAATDRFGERRVMALGLLGAGIALLAAPATRSAPTVGLALFAAGALGASVNAASGRAVMSWFAASSRGFAMGLRQTAVPLGGAAAALVLPVVVATRGTAGVFVVLAAACLAACVAVAVVMAPAARPAPASGPVAPATVSPLRDARILWLCWAGALLIVPQFTAISFLVVFLHDTRHVAAGQAAGLLAVAQFAGAAGRILCGLWSDAVSSRLRPLRIVAGVMAVGFVAIVVLSAAPLPALELVLVVVTGVAICWNGLAFTATAEMAAPGRSGMALGLQNTFNYVSAAVTPAAVGALALWTSWSVALVVVALCPILAIVALSHLLRLAPQTAGSPHPQE